MIKVLVAFPMADLRTGVSIVRGFEKLGCRIAVCDAKKNPDQLWTIAKKFRPDVLICSRTPQLLDGVIDIKANTDTHIVTWNVDTRPTVMSYAQEFGEDIIHLFQLSDVVYLVVKGEVDRFKHENINAKWLMQGIDDAMPMPTYPIEYKYDISFLGSTSNYHNEQRNRSVLLRCIKSEFGSAFNIENAYDEDALEVYKTSKINIGNNSTESVGPSVRDFKIMGAGGFLLTTHAPGIEDEFPSMVAYKNIDECIEKCHYYLENELERYENAAQWSIKVHDSHKYSDRLRIILDDYKEK